MSREAMQMALEALEQIHPGNLTPMAEEAWNKAITALRQALEEKQEPVAWMHNFIEGNVITHRPADIGRHPERWTPLYAAPPKREWVGLTDEELKPLCDENHIMFGAYTVDFIQAIEAKLKEKNHG